jgi:uncharacterized protein YegL
MGNGFYTEETPQNYEQKCACCLVLDVSGSMSGEPINQLNEGLKQFLVEVSGDETASSRLEVQLITFESEVTIEKDFGLLDEEYQMPNLLARGTTKMVDGLNRAIESIEERKNWYKETGQTYYRPYIILMTDGAPDGDQNIEQIKTAIKSGVDGKKFNFWAFGVEGADMNLLKDISHPEFSPQKLKGTDFVTFFKWLSSSMNAITNSRDGEKIDIAPKSEGDNPFQITV